MIDDGINPGLKLANSTWCDKEINAIKGVLESGRLTMGARVEEFEAAFAEFFNSRYAVMVNSGSSANLLMVAALMYSKNYDLARGDEVIVPAVSWSTTYAPLQQLGLTVRFVDVSTKTFNFDIDKLRDAVNDRTRIIFAVNLLGNPNDFESISQIICGHNIVVLEDNCESMGATVDGKCAGTFGLMGSFSTFFSHHISTIEGGVIVTSDEELFQILKSIREHGWTRCLPQNNLISGRKSDDWFSESFKFVLPGFNVRPTELNAVIGLAQLEKLNSIVKIRRKNAMAMKELVRDLEFLEMQQEIGEASWFGFGFIVVGLPRDFVLQKIGRVGFEYRPIVAGNFARNPVINFFDYSNDTLNFEGADIIHDQGFFIGNHHFDITDCLEMFAETLKRGEM